MSRNNSNSRKPGDKGIKFVEVGKAEPHAPRTRNGKKYRPVFEKAIEVFNRKFEGNRSRTNLPTIENCTLEYVRLHNCVRISAKKSRGRPFLSDAWIDLSSNYYPLQLRLAINNDHIAYLLWPESKDPTIEPINEPGKQIGT